MKFKDIDKWVVIKFVVLLFIIGLIGFAGIKLAPYIMEIAKEPEVAREYLLSYGTLGFMAVIIVQIVQVIIAVIPGDVVNFCGGYVYGVPIGFLLSFTGIMMGTIIVFYISRIFGYGFVSMIISKEKIDKLSGILNSSKGMFGMLVLCLIPGIPKDLLMYVAGLTPVKASNLFFVYALSRIPPTMIWVSVGANTFQKNYLEIALTVGAAVIFITLILLLKKRFENGILNNGALD